MLAARPAAVFIPSYRTTWLPQEDHDFIRERYVPLADNFWVLGSVLPAGGGEFEVFHLGRYKVVRVQPQSVAATAMTIIGDGLNFDREREVPGTLDGDILPKRPVELSVGLHRIKTPVDYQSAVVWVGPHHNEIPHMCPGNHRTLFWNWY